MLFRIRYYIRIHILYLVRTDVPYCIYSKEISLFSCEPLSSTFGCARMQAATHTLGSLLDLGVVLDCIVS